MHWTGRYRAYFNTKAEAPFVWSIDRGDQSTEVTIKGFTVHLNTEPLRSHFEERDNRTWPAPAAWIAGTGYVEILDGWAHIWG